MCTCLAVHWPISGCPIWCHRFVNFPHLWMKSFKKRQWHSVGHRLTTSCKCLFTEASSTPLQMSVCFHYISSCSVILSLWSTGKRSSTASSIKCSSTLTNQFLPSTHSPRRKCNVLIMRDKLVTNWRHIFLGRIWVLNMKSVVYVKVYKTVFLCNIVSHYIAPNCMVSCGGRENFMW